MTARRWAIGAAISAGLLLAAGARAQGERAQEDGRGPAGGERAQPEAPRKAKGDATKAAPHATGEHAAAASQAPRAKGGEAAGTPHARKAVPQQRSAQDVRRPVHGRRGGTGAERRTTAGEQVGAASGASAESPVEPPGPRTGGEEDSHAGGGTSSSGDTATGGWSGSSNPDPTQDRR
ncbi:conserved hypothetical protein [Anaeromyxobacter dehalogenans 2CP-1]|uniref:Translation initiation factor IF-2 n=1 Tax=Anaeromyxobacter dehalogenans (strain ATCC BAA-258 / DSM 21875 / 2CP-1) TaxID=455488 RepID=B8J6G9_ANAD2|nr:hypothetical protein [Anaeromyxobacter dehalogenans]ACL65150.1 conserved hypothetical protein [Anaeromyxobacter dehalogenans 2CP-1]